MEQLQQWIETAAAQLRCQKAVPGVKGELESHVYEQYHTFLAQGDTAAEAQRKTVESMGDPVLAGGALDRIHRPRPAWGPFCAAAALLLLGGALRWWQSLPLAADGTPLWRESAWQTLFAAEISVLVLALVYFCMDVSRLARWAWQLYLGLYCCRNDWFCLGRRQSTCALLLVPPAAAAAPLLVAARCFGAELPGMLARMLADHGAGDAGGAGYWLNGLQRMWAGMRWYALTGLLPFCGGSVDLLVQAAVVGLLLSAFRLDPVLHEPSAAPHHAPDAA